MKSCSHENHHQFSLSHQTLKFPTSLEMAKDQGGQNVDNIYNIYNCPTLRTPYSTMNFLVTNLEIDCHHSYRLTIPLCFWMVADSQLPPLLFLNQ